MEERDKEKSRVIVSWTTEDPVNSSQRLSWQRSNQWQPTAVSRDITVFKVLEKGAQGGGHSAASGGQGREVSRFCQRLIFFFSLVVSVLSPADWSRCFIAIWRHRAFRQREASVNPFDWGCTFLSQMVDRPSLDNANPHTSPQHSGELLCMCALPFIVGQC